MTLLENIPLYVQVKDVWDENKKITQERSDEWQWLETGWLRRLPDEALQEWSIDFVPTLGFQKEAQYEQV